jgi:hypothetical protein
MRRGECRALRYGDLADVTGRPFFFCRTVARPAAYPASRDILDPDGDDITARKLAVDSQCDPYRPELHYMREPGPKWHAKHVFGTGSNTPSSRQQLVEQKARLKAGLFVH